MRWWVWCCLGIVAQAASVRGTVVDVTEAPLRPEVVIHRDKQLAALVAKPKSGHFTIDVPAGSYLLEIRAVGFTPDIRHITVGDVGVHDVGRITLQLSGCEYPGVHCSYYGRGPRPVPAVKVVDVCAALRERPKDRWIVVVGRRSADGKSIEGSCGELPTLYTVRLPSRIVFDGPIIEAPFSKLGVRDLEKDIERLRARLRKGGEQGILVAAFGYMSVLAGMRVRKCNNSCLADFDVSPAHLLAIEAYRELP